MQINIYFDVSRSPQSGPRASLGNAVLGRTEASLPSANAQPIF